MNMKLEKLDNSEERGDNTKHNNFIKVDGFIKKRKKLIFVVVEFILAIFKNFCQSELRMCYHMSISPLRWIG